MFEPLWADSGRSWAALGLVQPFVLAVSASAVGDQEAAIRFCEAAIEGRDMLFALFGRWWPDFEGVRADRRYDDLLVRFNSRGGAGP